MKADCYVLHIYCDAGANCKGDECHENGTACGYDEEFTGKNRRETIQTAKRHGWIVGKTDYCPMCVEASRNRP